MPQPLALPSRTEYTRMTERQVVEYFDQHSRQFPRLDDSLRRAVEMTHTGIFSRHEPSQGMILNAVLAGLVLADESSSTSMLSRIDTMVPRVITKHENTVGEGMRSEDIYHLARLCIMYGILLYQDRMTARRR